MKKEISFSEGMKLTPYSDVSPDGELSVLHGNEVYAGSIRPCALDGDSMYIEQEDNYQYDLKYVHSTGEYEHLIIFESTGNNIGWIEFCKDETVEPIWLRNSSNDPIAINGLKSVSSVGNVLVFTTTENTYYAQWKDNAYIWLGSIPELGIRFSMTGKFVKESHIDLGVDKWMYSGIDNSIKYNNMAIAARKFEEKHCNEDGSFIHPFIVRAAYRMFNGRSWTKHTAPVLMTPNTIGPILSYVNTDISYMCYCSAYVCNLSFQLSNTIPSQWKDIISGIDIFISLPLDPNDYQYNADGKKPSQWFVHSDSKITGVNNWTMYGCYPDIDDLLPGMTSNTILDTKDNYDKLGETPNFYLLKTMSVESCNNTTSLYKLSMEKGYYNNLEFKDRLSDDYGSHDSVGAESVYTYNQRLTLGNLKKKMFPGDSVSNVMPLINSNSTGNDTYKFYWKRIQDGVESYSYCGSTSASDLVSHIRYIFTPDTYAKGLIVVKDSDDSYTEIQLEEHPFLNGMYKYNRNSVSLNFSGSIQIQTSEYIKNLPNTTITSEAENPFVFLAQGENRIGNGRILGLVSIATALSEGQFGGFPLMAFCTDGNYALKVITDGEYAGLYGEVSSMQRDVCTDRSTITQLDRSILYVSDRGVMIADGNDIQCISEPLDGVSDNFKLDGVTCYNGRARDFFVNCKCIWDYASQRAIFVNSSTEKKTAYVYHFRTKTWNTMQMTDLISNVQNVYPYSYMQSGVKIIKLNDDYNFGTSNHSGKIVTRPIKMDTLLMKKLTEFALQGRFSGNQTIKVYGSNDLVNWYNIGTTTRRRVGHFKGYYYKYWRFEIDTNLTESENITGLELRYDIRKESRMR